MIGSAGWQLGWGVKHAYRRMSFVASGVRMISDVSRGPHPRRARYAEGEVHVSLERLIEDLLAGAGEATVR
jgi:hypothetical protein